MNFLNTIGRGLGAFGRGATSALDYAALGGLPLNTLYPQGVPGEVRSNLRRNFLSNMGMALSASQPAMGPAMHRESAAGYLQNLAALQKQQALRSAIGNIVGGGKDVDYDKLASMYASLGMTEEANRYASLAESRRNGLSSRTIAEAGEARNAQAFPMEQRGRELNNQQTQQNVEQSGQAFPVEQRGRELNNRQTQQNIDFAAAINPWKVQIEKQQATGTQPIQPYQRQLLNNSDRDFKEGVRQFDVSAGQRGQEIGLYGRALGKMPTQFQSEYTGLGFMDKSLQNYINALDSLYSPTDLPGSKNQYAVAQAYQQVILDAKEANRLGVLNGRDLDVLMGLLADPYSIQGRVAGMGSGDWGKQKDILKNQAQTLQDAYRTKQGQLGQMYGYSPRPTDLAPIPPPPSLQRLPQQTVGPWMRFREVDRWTISDQAR